MKQIKIAVIALLFLVEYGVSQNCPTASDLEDSSVPKVSQIDSSTIQVDWSDLWTQVDWTGCFSEVEIVVNDIESLIVEDIESQTANISATPCEETRVKIQATLSETGENVTSFGSDLDFKTFKSPQAKNLSQLELEHHVEQSGTIDLTSVDLKVSFQDLVEEPGTETKRKLLKLNNYSFAISGCRKVVGAELRYRKTRDDLFENEDVWTVFENYGIAMKSDSTQ